MMNTRDYQKAFALACRFLADNIGCPAAYISDVHFPECNGESEQCGNEALWKCWQKYFHERVKNEQVCRVCGCTENNACPGGCWWVENGLCSSCVLIQMKYFEFRTDDSGNYYALVCAESKDKAVGIYNEVVGELDQDYIGPTDISRDIAKLKYLKAGTSNAEENSDYFETAKNEVLLIDGNLT